MDPPVDPNLFTGFKSPVYMGDALQFFFSNAVINLYDEDHVINLLDYFPLLKQGHAQRHTIIRLFFLYIKMNGLAVGNMVIPDQLMLDSFAGNISATYYRYGSPDYRITMDEALNDGLIKTPLNTFKVIRDPGFNPNNFPTYIFQQIIEYNSTKYDFLPNRDDFMRNQQLLRSLVHESGLVTELNKSLKIYINSDHHIQNNIDDIYTTAFQTMLPILMQTLEDDPNVNKLRLSIIRQDIPSIRNYLKMYDPRDNNHKAYFLAVNTNNEDILTIIKQNIIQRTLLEGTVFADQIEENLGMKTTIPKDVYNMTRTRFF